MMSLTLAQKIKMWDMGFRRLSKKLRKPLPESRFYMAIKKMRAP